MFKKTFDIYERFLKNMTKVVRGHFCLIFQRNYIYLEKVKIKSRKANNILALQQQDAENDNNFENSNQNQSENDPEERNILRGWHKSSRLVHFFRAIYERKKNVEIFF